MADAEIESKSVDQGTLVADIDRTRAELARTIDAISDRVSPKKNVQRATDRLRQRISQIDPVVAGAAAAAVVVSVTVLFLVRRGRRPRPIEHRGRRPRPIEHRRRR
jgi:Protein of unknown function (DUF3618)